MDARILDPILGSNFLILFMSSKKNEEGVSARIFLGFLARTPIKLVLFKGETHKALHVLRFREIEFWRLSLIEGFEPQNCSKPSF